MKNITVWRLQTNTDNITDYSVADYCIDKNVLALGWSLNDSHLGGYPHLEKLINKRASISEGEEDDIFRKYENFVDDYNVYKDIYNVRRLKQEVNPFDLVWMRRKGVYWLGLICENSRYYYDSTKEVLDMDASNQRTDVKWFEIGGEADVAGVIATSFIKGQTLRRINQVGVLEFSQNLINKLYKPVYDLKNLEKSSENFFNLISPDDCEDLLCMWLYKKYGYISIPSTSKSSTQLYECVLINTKNTDNKKVYIQVKKGDIDLNYSEYKDLDGEVWLFTTRGKIIGDKLDNMNSVDPQEIYEFAISGENDNFLPDKILKWRNLLKS